MKYKLTPDVGADDFYDFVTYCIFQKNFTIFQVRDLACYPHKFKKEYSDFMDSLKQYEKKSREIPPREYFKNINKKNRGNNV